MSPEEAAFEYELPRDLIAQEPLPNRADARLMLIHRLHRKIDHFHIRDLPELLDAGDRIILNDTQVIPARLVGRRALTGGRWQGLYLGQLEGGRWRLIQKARGNIQPGEVIHIDDREGRMALAVRLVGRCSAGQWIAEPICDLNIARDPFAILDRVGRVPLPPYIRNGNMVDADWERYQTVFACQKGSVAAPTAGLHFTKSLLRQMESRGIQITSITLHVGLDTFRPISTKTIEEHAMHSEWIDVSPHAVAQINATSNQRKRIIAIGTTCVRSLETAARSACQPDRVAPFRGATDLFIHPPYPFRAVDAMLTNFHFPRTTLLVLVSTFAGRELMKQAYAEAIAERYRFYSYGDAMLII